MQRYLLILEIMITRIAPTPSGYIHKGNVFNFLLNWLWARNNGGKVLLRIDDADAERKRKEYVEDIFRVLDWLGLDWDIGPSGPDELEANWSQLKRKNLYEDLLKELDDNNLVFACDCNRKQICNCSKKDLSLIQDNICWKIRTDKNSSVPFHDKILGEVKVALSPFVVRKKDGFASYQLCSLADDRHFNVTHICRGNDLKESTAMQLYIDKQLANPYLNTCSFWHHGLLTSSQGEKFSKSAGVLGSSIIGSWKKEDLFTSFAAWLAPGINDGTDLNNLQAMAIFKIT